MRDYAQFRPQFWTEGSTGRELREYPLARLVASYLFTNQHSNMIGLYYLPIPLIAHELAMTPEALREELQRVIEVEFCAYDDRTEYVFVFNGARDQIGRTLKARDKRVQGVLSLLEQHRRSPYFHDFLRRYWVPYNLGTYLPKELLQGPSGLPLKALPEAPPKALPSQDQDQDQDQEQEQEQEKEGAAEGASGWKAGSDRVDVLYDAPGPELEPGEPEPEHNWRTTEELVRRRFTLYFTEKRGGPPTWTPKNAQHLRTVAGWVDEKNGDTEAIVERVLQGYFRSTFGRSVNYAIGGLASDVQQFFAPTSNGKGFLRSVREESAAPVTVRKAANLFGPAKGM
jgi:hypothetical protein